MGIRRDRSTELAAIDKTAAALGTLNQNYDLALAGIWMVQDLTARSMSQTARLNTMRHALAGGDPFLDYLLASDVVDFHAVAHQIRSSLNRPR